MFSFFLKGMFVAVSVSSLIWFIPILSVESGRTPGVRLPASARPRVLVLTDISSLRAGFAEPDDGQSMTRFVLYTNVLQVEGLIACSNLGHGQKTQPELIHQVIDAYGKVQGNLLKHDPAYPAATHLHELVKTGQPLAGPKVPVTTSIGAGLDTEASEWIIRVVDQPDPRPVWVCVWGGTADLAQALWKIQQTRSEAAVKAFVGKLRVHAIADQDMTGPWIRQQFPGLFYILNRHNFRGIYRGGDTRLADSSWVENHIHFKDNPLGLLYPNYAGGDIWGKQLGRVKGMKEGDTSSFLNLIINGLNNPEHPEWGGWGGLFKRADEGYFQDQVDSTAGYATDMTPYMAAVYRWRPAWQADFEARLRWCTKPYAQANHSPVVVVDRNASPEPIQRVVSTGSVVHFDAGKSSDPDHQKLNFHWQFYPESTSKGVVLKGDQTSRVTCQIAKDAPKQTVSLLLTITDAGQPALSSYRRIVLQVRK
jgi:hypothetical protein